MIYAKKVRFQMLNLRAKRQTMRKCIWTKTSDVGERCKGGVHGVARAS